MRLLIVTGQWTRLRESALQSFSIRGVIGVARSTKAQLAADRQRGAALASGLADTAKGMWNHLLKHGGPQTLRWVDSETGVAITVTEEPVYRDKHPGEFHDPAMRLILHAEKDGVALPMEGANPFFFVCPQHGPDMEAAFIGQVTWIVLHVARSQGWVG